MKEGWEYYTQEKFEKDVQTIVDLLSFNPHLKFFKNIYGPPAGGLILATYLHYRLNDITIIFDQEKITDRTLIVDDIADTGKTLERYVKTNFIITLFWHRQCSFEPTIWLREKKEKWIHFPWVPLKEKG